MKPRIALLILLGSLVGLLLLIRATPATPAVMPTVAVTVTPAPTIVVPSRTPLPSSTATPPAPTATVTLADTATAPQLPSATLPLIKGSVADYQLTVPPADALLDLYVEAHQKGDKLCFSEASNRNWLWSDFQAIRDVTLFYIHQFYSNGLPVAGNFLDVDWGQDCGFSTPDLGLLTEAAWNDLKDRRWNGSGQLSTPNFTVDIYKVELDGDPQPEWLLRIAFANYGATTWLTLDEMADGQYRRLSSADLQSEHFFEFQGEPYVIGIADLTGDRLSDLVITDDTYTWGTIYDYVKVLHGTSDGFKQILYLPSSYRADEDSPTQEIAHLDSGQPYLHLVSNNNINLGCYWKTEELYSWPNGIEHHTTKGNLPPNTPQCAVAKAVSTLVKPPDNPTAIRLLESALKDFATNPADPPDYELFVHYRLAVLYALEGQQAAARQHLLWLKTYAGTNIANTTDSDYRDFVYSSVAMELAADQVNPIRLCDAMASHTNLLAQRLDYVKVYSATYSYPFSSDPYPPSFCPVDDVLTQVLSKFPTFRNTSFEVAFGQVGLTLVDVQPIALARGNQADAVVLKLSEPRLVFLTNGRVSAVAHTFRDTVGDLLTLAEDLTGDGLKDQAFAYRMTATYYCQSNEDAYDIVVIVPQADGTLKTLADVGCLDSGQLLYLKSWLADKDDDGESDWVKARLAAEQNAQYQPDRDPAWLNFDTVLALKSSENELDGIRNLDSDFYKSPNASETRALLQKALAAIPASDPNAPRVRQHLNYLIAMSYELEGRDELALQTYYDIWADPTPTLWGHLAAIHLAHK